MMLSTVVIDQGILTPWFSPFAAHNKLLGLLFKKSYQSIFFPGNLKSVQIGGF